MDLTGVRFPGSRLLRRRVERDCDPATAMGELGHRFGDWIVSGADAPPSTVEVVEDRLAWYLETAAAAGWRWGFRAGLIGGTAVLGCAMLLALLAWAVFG